MGAAEMMSRRLLGLLLFAAACTALHVGDRIPSVTIHSGFPPTEVDIAARIAGKKVILSSLPGAFTPT